MACQSPSAASQMDVISGDLNESSFRNYLLLLRYQLKQEDAHAVHAFNPKLSDLALVREEGVSWQAGSHGYTDWRTLREVFENMKKVNSSYLSGKCTQKARAESARQLNEEKNEPKMLKFSDADLAEYTNNFHQDNLIGSTQFCKLYRGKINAQDVTIKIWDGKQFGVEYPEDYIVMLQERIKVALRFAHLLELLHGQVDQYRVLNIDAEHILLDQDWNPVLVEFGQMRGGNFSVSYYKQAIPMSIGYVDPYFAKGGVGWVAHCDVFSYGVILLGLIAKRVHVKKKWVTEWGKLVDDWAWKQYKPGCSLVHGSLEDDLSYRVDDGLVITELAMRCVEELPGKRPTMESVVKSLEGLLVVQVYV
ncbi:hypothetical protein RJ640_030856 [Escallonia rubra]|uniref:Protein kinase domain-containing protein n=1 Tax=Escallonia rubra TaxID=112253 RepID=A0AA88U3S8_9ASTE|nr:hypothetical protein RJ640_030856 [Escallonia rubra]